jgi:inorganic pyrophosphatase
MDIDAYASAVAMAKLLRLQGEDTIAASTAPLNGSIPESLRSLDVQFSANYKPSPEDVFTIVDLSDPEHLDFSATPDKVVGVIDHHLGFEDFWKEKIGDKAHIEFIGAACTQVYELWQKSGLLNKMSAGAAELLACGILDNTLNFKAKITTERDKAAYAALAQQGRLPHGLPEQYFTDCQQHILNNLEHALKNDSKIVPYPGLPHKTHVGQLALWDAKDFIHSAKNVVRETLCAENLPWFMNTIDIHSGQSLFFCENPELKAFLEHLLNVKFKDDAAAANRMWLRKEIMRQAIEKRGKR